MKTFAKRKFYSLLLASTFASMIEYFSFVSDSVIAGLQIGEDALAALNFASPFFSVIVFVCFLIGVGTQVMVAYHVGRGDRNRGNDFFGQGFLLALFCGIVMTVTYLLMRNGLSQRLSVPTNVAVYLNEYFAYMCILPIVMIVGSLFFCVILNEGRELLCTVASGIQIASNIILSVWLCGLIGIGGIALGTIISNVLLVAILSIHFFTKKNMLRFRIHFKLKDALNVVKYSVVESLNYLYIAIIGFVMNEFLIQTFSQQAVVIFSVIMIVMAFQNTLYDGLSDGISGLVNVYRGENNVFGIKKTMSAATKQAVLFGIISTLPFVLFANLLPQLFGITDPQTAANMAEAVRIFAFSGIPTALITLYMFYYSYSERIGIASQLITLQELLLMPILAIFMGKLFGITGVWIGLMLASFIALFLGAWLVKLQKKNTTFPLLLDKTIEKNQLSYDTIKAKSNAQDMVNAICKDLKSRGVSPEKVANIGQIIKETALFSIANNKEKRRGDMLECTVFLADKTRIIIRDSGTLCDVCSAVLEEQSGLEGIKSVKDREYILTQGYNRTLFWVN